jgi:hypothetical protein
MRCFKPRSRRFDSHALVSQKPGANAHGVIPWLTGALQMQTVMEAADADTHSCRAEVVVARRPGQKEKWLARGMLEGIRAVRSESDPVGCL